MHIFKKIFGKKEVEGVKKIEIEPMTRLEGHGKIAIFLDDKGNVADAFYQIVEFRGYETFLRGMPIEEVPRTVSTICGVCRAIHHTASTKASDGVYGVEPTETAKKIRELFLNAHQVEDHCAILYALGLPDFVVGIEADPAERNLVGLVKKVGVDVGKTVLKKRFAAVKVLEMLGGKPIHPVAGLPGGWSKRVTEDERKEIESLAKEMVELGELTLQVFEDVILKNEKMLELVTADYYRVVVNYLGTVDDDGKVNYYDGWQVGIDTKGNEVFRFKGKDYLNHIAERVVPWSYVKMPYFKQLGWKGFVDGEGTSLYSVGPLARCNVGEMNTPKAKEAQDKMFDVLKERPIHYIMAYHWARAVELLNAAERVLELSQDPEITSPDVRAELGEVTGEGVGIVEAPRGTLIHHYKTDENGIVTDVNLIVATTHNHPSINIAIKKAAQHFIKEGKDINEKLLNYIEIAYRPYDICQACASHALPGRYPIEVTIYDSEGEIVKVLRNF